MNEFRDDIEQVLVPIRPFFPLQIVFPSDLVVDICSFTPCGNSLYRDYAVRCQVERDPIFCSHECRVGDWIRTSSVPTEYPKRFQSFSEISVAPECNKPELPIDYLDPADPGRLVEFFDLPIEQLGYFYEESSEDNPIKVVREFATALLAFLIQKKRSGQGRELFQAFDYIRVLWCRAAATWVYYLADPHSNSSFLKDGLADCNFLLYSGILESIDEDTVLDVSHLRDLRRRFLQANMIGPTIQTEIRKAKRKKKKRRDTKEVKSFSIDVGFCRDLVGTGSALNVTTAEDGCPVCLKEWNTFDSLDLAIVLPCLHAICAPCLSRHRAECRKSFETDLGEFSTSFTCTICRERIRSNILYQAAQTLLAENLVESLSVLAESLPLPKKIEAGQLVTNILIQNHFDIMKTENALFNLICLSAVPEASDLDHDKKQDIYQTARKPVRSLESDIDLLTEKLAGMQVGSNRYARVCKQIDDLKTKLHESRLNAAADIYERMNAVQKKESQVDIMSIDLHGLHVEEAKSILQDYVLPVLPVLKKVNLITGRGKHSDTNYSTLKESIKKFLSEEIETPLRCEERMDNQGVLFVAM